MIDASKIVYMRDREPDGSVRVIARASIGAQRVFSEEAARYLEGPEQRRLVRRDLYAHAYLQERAALGALTCTVADLVAAAMGGARTHEALRRVESYAALVQEQLSGLKLMMEPPAIPAGEDFFELPAQRKPPGAWERSAARRKRHESEG